MSLQYLSHSILADAYASLGLPLPSYTASSSLLEFPEIKLIPVVNWLIQQAVTECLCWGGCGTGLGFTELSKPWSHPCLARSLWGDRHATDLYSALRSALKQGPREAATGSRECQAGHVEVLVRTGLSGTWDLTEILDLCHLRSTCVMGKTLCQVLGTRVHPKTHKHQPLSFREFESRDQQQQTGKMK